MRLLEEVDLPDGEPIAKPAISVLLSIYGTSGDTSSPCLAPLLGQDGCRSEPTGILMLAQPMVPLLGLGGWGGRI